MELFIDTADISEIKKALENYSIDGVTTNPSLVAKSDRCHEDLIKEICELVKKPVSAEVLEIEEKLMFQEAKKLAKIHESVVVKIPLIESGLKVVRKLNAENIKTNVTLCFSPNQALLAAKAGATYVSVFLGRLDDIGHNGAKICIDCHEVLKNYNLKTKILAASIRHPLHISETIKKDIPVATIPYKIFPQLLKHPLTDLGLKKFLEDAKKI